MEIRVQRDDDSPFPSRKQEQLVIRSGRHSDVAGVDHVEAEAMQLGHCQARQPLIEQKVHALLGSSMTLSSSEAAAYAKACWMSSLSSSGYSRNSSLRSGYVASASSTRLTVSRELRTHGWPFIRLGSEVMRSKGVMGAYRQDSARIRTSTRGLRALPHCLLRPRQLLGQL